MESDNRSPQPKDIKPARNFEFVPNPQNNFDAEIQKEIFDMINPLMETLIVAFICQEDDMKH